MQVLIFQSTATHPQVRTHWGCPFRVSADKRTALALFAPTRACIGMLLFRAAVGLEYGILSPAVAEGHWIVEYRYGIHTI